MTRMATTEQKIRGVVSLFSFILYHYSSEQQTTFGLLNKMLFPNKLVSFPIVDLWLPYLIILYCLTPFLEVEKVWNQNTMSKRKQKTDDG